MQKKWVFASPPKKNINTVPCFLDAITTSSLCPPWTESNHFALPLLTSLCCSKSSRCSSSSSFSCRSSEVLKNFGRGCEAVSSSSNVNLRATGGDDWRKGFEKAGENGGGIIGGPQETSSTNGSGVTEFKAGIGYHVKWRRKISFCIIMGPCQPRRGRFRPNNSRRGSSLLQFKKIQNRVLYRSVQRRPVVWNRFFGNLQIAADSC